jgi:hypothetical protein
MCSYKAWSQSPEESVKQPIMHFFEGMKKGDSVLLRSSMAPKAILQTIAKTKEGNMVVRTEDLQAFITSVTKPHEGIYDERITFETIKIDADLAIVWTSYNFYIGEQFSHCGVNSFQLVRLNGSWKIQYIIDTRRKDNCL